MPLDVEILKSYFQKTLHCLFKFVYEVPGSYVRCFDLLLKGPFMLSS